MADMPLAFRAELFGLVSGCVRASGWGGVWVTMSSGTGAALQDGLKVQKVTHKQDGQDATGS